MKTLGRALEEGVESGFVEDFNRKNHLILFYRRKTLNQNSKLPGFVGI